MSGLIADSRTMVDKARVEAQVTQLIVKLFCDTMLSYDVLYKLMMT